MEIHRQKRKWKRIENLVDMSNWLENVLKILNSELALNDVEKDAVTNKPIGKPFLSWVKSFATVHDCFARLKVQQAWTCFQPVLRIPHQVLSE